LNIGANSLDMLRVVNEVERQLGFRPKVDDFFSRPTIAGLAELRRSYEASAAKSTEAAVDDFSDIGDFSETTDIVLDPKQRDAFKRQSLEVRQFPQGTKRFAVPTQAPGIRELEALAARRSYREFDPRPLSMEQLFSTLSCLKRLVIDGRPRHKYASAGGLYPVQTYLYIKPDRVEGIPQGTYYYDALTQELVVLQTGAQIEAGIHVAYNQAYFSSSAFSVFLVADTSALRPLYADLSEHLATLEAGLMAQLLDMTGPACGVGFCQIGTLSFEPVRGLFELKDSHILVHSLLGGRIPVAEAATHATEDGEEGTI